MNKNHNENYNCKHCRFFGIKDRKSYWCFVPELQEIKRQDLLEIKYEEIKDRYCEYFQRKLM